MPQVKQMVLYKPMVVYLLLKPIYNGTNATLAADSGTVTMGSTTAATVSATGIVNVNNTTDATSKTDGSLQTDGGLSVVNIKIQLFIMELMLHYYCGFRNSYYGFYYCCYCIRYWYCKC